PDGRWVLEQTQETRRRREIRAPPGQRLHRFLILAPLVELPLLVERGGGPGGGEVERALGQGQSDDQRAGDGDQRRQAGQLERVARADRGGEAGDGFGRLGFVGDAGGYLDGDVVAASRPVQDRIPEFRLPPDQGRRARGAVAEQVALAIDCEPVREALLR